MSSNRFRHDGFIFHAVRIFIGVACLISMIPLASSVGVVFPLDVTLSEAETSEPVVANNERSSFADCGVANDPGRQSRIVGGEEATPNEFPWIALLNIEMESGKMYSCAGSLINDRWIATSAGCTSEPGDKAKAIYVHLGVHNRSSSSTETTDKLYMGQMLIVHPGWDSATITNDISLVCLRTPVTFSQYMRPVCLADPIEPSYDGRNATIAGWGRTSDGSTSSSAVLRKVTVPVISNAKCRTYYSNAIPNEVICTDGTNSRGACYGDGGAPLNYKQSDGTWKLIGISSFISSAGCQTGNPSGFIRISSYSTWIQENIAIDCSPPTTSTSSTTVASSRTTTTTATTTTKTTPTMTATPKTTAPTTTEPATIQPTTFDCAGKPNGNYPNPASACSTTFYMCSNGEAHLFDCASSLVYRQEIGACDWPSNVAGCH